MKDQYGHLHGLNLLNNSSGRDFLHDLLDLFIYFG